MSLETIKGRDAMPWERCQFPVPALVRGDPPRPCRKTRDKHVINYGYQHPFTYDPATDASPEADRRALLRVAKAAEKLRRDGWRPDAARALADAIAELEALP